VKWSEKYLTGIKRIDDHHKALFEMSEVFRDALIERRGERVYGGLLDSLGVYAGAHFGCEEGCMERCQCPAAQRNTEAHLQFLQGLSVFKERYTLVGFEREEAWRCVEFIDHWLDVHICRIDIQLRPFAQHL
jgi:hemerythrin